MKRFCALAALIVLLCLGSLAWASTAVNWSTGGAYVEKVGNNGLFGPEYPGNPVQTDCDKVTLDAASGSLNLVLGSPQILMINPLTLQIDQTGSQGTDENYTLTTEFSMTRNLTINGLTRSLVSPMTHVVTWNWDSLQVHQGSPLAFGNIIVTPLGWSTAFADGIGVFDQTSPSWHTISPIYAEFSLSAVPEPSSVLVLGSGLLALAGMIRKRR